jgi:tetratricopeptide (TPR) repeat protein
MAVVHYNGRAWTYLLAGQAAQALPDAETSLQLRPDDPVLLNTRGRAFEVLGRRDEAIADFRQALSKNPSLPDSRDALMRLGAAP